MTTLTNAAPVTPLRPYRRPLHKLYVPRVRETTADTLAVLWDHAADRAGLEARETIRALYSSLDMGA